MQYRSDCRSRVKFYFAYTSTIWIPSSKLIKWMNNKKGIKRNWNGDYFSISYCKIRKRGRKLNVHGRAFARDPEKVCVKFSYEFCEYARCLRVSNFKRIYRTFFLFFSFLYFLSHTTIFSFSSLHSSALNYENIAEKRARQNVFSHLTRLPHDVSIIHSNTLHFCFFTQRS